MAQDIPPCPHRDEVHILLGGNRCKSSLERTLLSIRYVASNIKAVHSRRGKWGQQTSTRDPSRFLGISFAPISSSHQTIRQTLVQTIHLLRLVVFRALISRGSSPSIDVIQRGLPAQNLPGWLTRHRKLARRKHSPFIINLQLSYVSLIYATLTDSKRTCRRSSGW